MEFFLKFVTLTKKSVWKIVSYQMVFQISMLFVFSLLMSLFSTCIWRKVWRLILGSE